MAAITSAGYQDLRDYIQANWQYIELRDTSGAAVVRLPVSDARVDWVHATNAQTLQLRVILTGSDADVPVPVTFRSGALYKVAGGGNPFSVETLVEGDALINADPDVVQATLSIQVPQV